MLSNRLAGPRRVLMTADTFGDGWVYALELCDALSSLGLEIFLATLGGTLRPDQRDQLQPVRGLHVVESMHQYPEWAEDRWTELEAAGQWLLQLERECKPDIIHLNHVAYGDLPWQAPVVVVGHACMLSWWQAVKQQSPPPIYQTYRHKMSQALQAADLVVASTQSLLATLAEYYGPLPRRAVVSPAHSAARFRVGKKEPFILSAGRVWDEARNVSVVEKIAPHLPWPVCIAGDDHSEQGKVQPGFARHLGFMPPDELAAWFARAEIFVLPARYEPLGFSVLAAALSGCALILGDIPTLRELWDGAALFVSPGDPAALQAVIKRLISNPSQRGALAKQAYARGLSFSPQKMVMEYSRIYAQVFNRRQMAHLKHRITPPSALNR